MDINAHYRTVMLFLHVFFSEENLLLGKCLNTVSLAANILKFRTLDQFLSPEIWLTVFQLNYIVQVKFYTQTNVYPYIQSSGNMSVKRIPP